MRLRWGIITGMIGGVVACRPSDVLSVPAPAGVTTSRALASQAGAEAAFTNARFQLFSAVAGELNVLTWSELLTDEFVFNGVTADPGDANIDARATAAGGGFAEGGDGGWQALLNARSVLLLAVPGLATYEPAGGQSKVGEAYALIGYAELFLAEDYCAGTPLDRVLPGGAGVQYGTPLTTDSLLGVAEVHFDSALAHANGDATVEGLASVGLGRTLLDRGQYLAAGMAVSTVPVGFVYNTELAPSYDAGGVSISNMYAYAYSYPYGSFLRFFNVSDGEGGNGLHYRSAADPRLTFDSSLTTADGGTWYLPTKFEVNFAYLPLATGVEAALIGAEATLQGGDAGGWATDLNAIRANAPGTYLQLADSVPSLTPDSTLTASAAEQVDVMFRERAFWLFGTGTRLGDLRRLVRQYGRDQSTVYPTGPYANGNNPNLPSPLPNYGTDVDLTLPTAAGLASDGLTAITNPNYKGCVTPTSSA
jgi:hypothetical protein